jgi:hypothetical protein
MEPDIPPEQLERFPALKQLLGGLRGETERLGPLDDSALTFHPDEGVAE